MLKKFLVVVGLMAAIAACEPAQRSVGRGVSPQSGALVVSRDDSRILIAAEDHDQLLIVNKKTKAVVGRVAVGDAPVHVVELIDGSAAVTNRFGHSISVVNVDTGTVVRTVEVGSEPYGLVEISPMVVAVALAGESAVAIVDLDAGVVQKTIKLQDRDPRAVALLDDGTLYVTHMASGRFSRVDVDAGIAHIVDVSTANNFGPRVHPEHMRSITLDPKSGTVLVAHSQANSDTVRAPIGDVNVDPGTGGGGSNCGYDGCATELGAVEPGVTEVDPGLDVVVVTQSSSQAQNPNVPVNDSDCFDCEGGFGTATPNPPSIFNTAEARFAGVQIQGPAAVALFESGRGQIVVNTGSKNALLMRRNLNGTAQDVVGVVKLGNGAQSIAMDASGATAFVWNQFDGTLSEFALPNLADDVKQTKFRPDASGRPVAADELSVVPEFAATTTRVVEDALPANVSLGRKMFNDATNGQISKNGAISCAACHPDGRQDGQTWQFVFGPRNTPSLGGGILDTAPFHWPGDVATVPDLNTNTVMPFMGGSGLPQEDFQLIASFIDSIRAAPTPVAAKAELAANELRGKAIFESDATQCSACHAGNHFTDNLGYNVGSKASAADISVFQVPVLHSLDRTAPYLHDGSARDLTDVVNNYVRNDKMGKGSHLSEEQLTDLIAYLKTL